MISIEVEAYELSYFFSLEEFWVLSNAIKGGRFKNGEIF